jgi:hypothetical protein
MVKILKLNRDLVARSIVNKYTQKAKKVRTELAKQVRHERSKGQARVMVSREVFGSFFKLHFGNALWFKSMRSGVGMPKHKVHEKLSAWVEAELRIGTDCELGHMLDRGWTAVLRPLARGRQNACDVVMRLCA